MFKSKVMTACFAAALVLPVCISTAVAQDGGSDDMAAIRAAAEKGNPEAEFKLSGTYLMGPRVPGDELEGLKWLQLSAQQGFAKAQGMLASEYFTGDGEIKKNESEAIKWALLASAQGEPFADMTLAHIYLFGTQTKHDKSKAIGYLRADIEKRFGNAEGLLANIYLGVAGGDPDNSQALSWAERAINDGDSSDDGKAALGAIYLFGLGVPQDYQKGMSYLNDNKSTFAAAYLATMQDNINKQNAAVLQRMRSMPPMPIPATPSAGFVPEGSQSLPISQRVSSISPPPNYGASTTQPIRMTESGSLSKEEGAGGGYMTCYYRTSGGYQFTTTSSGSCPGTVEVDPESGQATYP